MDNLAPLTIGVTLLYCVLGVLGLHAYATGKAQRAGPGRPALLDRPDRTCGRRRRFRELDRRLRRTKLGKRLELRLAATGLDITPGEFFVYVLATVAALWLIAAGRPGPLLRPDRRTAAHLGRRAFLNWQRTETHRGVHQPTPRTVPDPGQRHPGRAWPCARPSAMAAEELEAPAGEELAQGGRPVGGRPRPWTTHWASSPNACPPVNWSSSSPPWSSPTGPAAQVVSSLRNLTRPWRSARRPGARSAPSSPRST